MFVSFSVKDRIIRKLCVVKIPKWNIMEDIFEMLELKNIYLRTEWACDILLWVVSNCILWMPCKSWSWNWWRHCGTEHITSITIYPTVHCANTRTRTQTRKLQVHARTWEEVGVFYTGIVLVIVFANKFVLVYDVELLAGGELLIAHHAGEAVEVKHFAARPPDQVVWRDALRTAATLRAEPSAGWRRKWLFGYQRRIIHTSSLHCPVRFGSELQRIDSNSRLKQTTNSHWLRLLTSYNFSEHLSKI